MFVGAAIGAGAGALIGAVSAPGCSAPQRSSFLGCFNVVSRADLALGVGAAGIAVGAPIGYFTDFTKSTVYKAR